MPKIVRNDAQETKSSTAQLGERLVTVPGGSFLANVSATVASVATPSSTTIIQNLVIAQNVGGNVTVTGENQAGGNVQTSAQPAKEVVLRPYFKWILLGVIVVFFVSVIGVGYIGLFIANPTDTQNTILQTLLHVLIGSAMAIIGLLTGKNAP